MTLIPESETIRVAIVDSHGSEDIHPAYKETLSHVTFHGATPVSLVNEPLHGHGGWCAWDWASQSTQPLEIMLIRVFDKDGRKAVPDSFEFEALKDFKPHYVNYSSGASRGSKKQEAYLKQHYNRWWKEAWLETIGDAIAFMSAGNSSRYEYSYPQRVLVGHPQVKIIAACQADGHVASFSSTAKWNERYVDAAYLGQNCKSLDARSATVVTWNGTSSSCPHAGGDICARRIKDGASVDAYWAEIGGKNGKYNAEVGLGVCEGGRQENMTRTGLGLGSLQMHGPAVTVNFEDAAMYHDFERLS